MSLIIPDSVVNMYADVPISGGHQLVFSSKNAQTNYFANKRLVTKAGCSYIRKTGRLRIEFNAARVQQCNYMSFTNTSFEDVTFYAKILDYEYVNNVTTDVIYAIDYWQTYMFDAKFHACNIIREHLTEMDYQLSVTNPYTRDIPEMLTDEGLPVGESLECIYTEGTNQGGQIIGNRFNMLSGIPIIENLLTSYRIVMLLSPIRKYDELTETEQTQFRNFLSLWSTLNGQEFDSSTVNVDTMFSVYRDHFVSSVAVLEMPVSNYQKLSQATSILAALDCTGCITGLYLLPAWAAAGGNWATGFVIPKLDVHNQKLNTFPFRYLRVKTPLDTKEYRLDLFNSLQESSDNFVSFSLISNVNGVPIIAIAPKGYKNTSEDANYYERLEYAAFPQIGVATDAYLSFINSVMRSTIVSNTYTRSDEENLANVNATISQIKPYTESAGSVGGALSSAGSKFMSGDIIGGLTSLGGSGMNTVSGFQQGQAQADLATSQYAKMRDLNVDADFFGSGSSMVYNNAKRAFVANDYKPGGAAGYLPYEMDTLTFTCEIVTLNKDIIDKYDAYFKCYGYKSLRSGRPHICDYVTDGTNAPHFNTYDDETFTYVQTENMHVTGLQQAACTFIENLFNSGCRFVKGD